MWNQQEPVMSSACLMGDAHSSLGMSGLSNVKLGMMAAKFP